MRIVLFAMFALLSFLGKSQVTDTVTLNYNNSAFLLFESDDLIFSAGVDVKLLHVSQFENKITIEMGHVSFEQTNLFVECGNKVYMFIVKKGDPGSKFVYDYSGMKNAFSSTNDSNEVDPVGKEILKGDISKKDSLELEYRKISEMLMVLDDRIYNRGIVRYRLGIYLKDVRIFDDKLFFEFEYRNKSNINYDVDFRLFDIVPTKRRIKGESFQEISLTPLLEYKAPAVFAAKENGKFVIVFDKFVLTNGKRMKIEFWEDNGSDMNIEGGRKVTFDLFSKDLLQTIKI